MFGFVMANPKELTPAELDRYRAHYCGICKAMGRTCSGPCRLCLSYDMAFLSLTLSSLYEPEEQTRRRFCALHPIRGCRPAESEILDYAAQMNVALAYYNCRDDWQDDRNLWSLGASRVLGGSLPRIREQFPRQCAAIEDCIRQLGELEKANCPNPDEPANCFGRLMAELFRYRVERWSEALGDMAMALGRFIYLADACVDYDRDKKRGSYNPLLQTKTTPQDWENILVQEMSASAAAFERLPLVQDKALLDKILYSGVWMTYRKKMAKKREDTQ